MQAHDLMSTALIAVSPDATVVDAANAMLEHNVSAVLVVGADGRLLGILSEGDLLRRSEIDTAPRHSWLGSLMVNDEQLASEYLKSRAGHVADVMSADVITVKKTTGLKEVVELMEKHHIKRVVVVEGRKPVGIISRRDVLRALVGAAAKRTEVSLSSEQMRQIAKANIALAGLSSYPVDLTISGRKASISARVPSEQIAKALLAAVADTPGITSVKNGIAVVTPVLPVVS